jgi:hypothetical protein
MKFHGKKNILILVAWCICLLSFAGNAGSEIMRKAECVAKLDATTDSGYSLVKYADDLLVYSQKKQECHLAGKQSGIAPAAVSPRLSRHFNALAEYKGSLYSLSADDGTIYEGQVGMGTPVCNLDNLFYGNADKQGKKGNLLHDFLAFDGTWFYAIVLAGYSSRIIRVDPQTKKEEMVDYIDGVPAGLTYVNGKIWYVSNTTKDELDAFIRIFTPGITEPPNRIRLPGGSVKGLAVDGNDMYCISKRENRIFKYRVK